MATIDTVKEVLEENLDINPETVSDDSTFDSLGIDSLDTVELLMNLEDKLGIEVELDQKVETVGDLVAFGEPEALKTVGELVEYIDSL